MGAHADARPGRHVLWSLFIGLIALDLIVATGLFVRAAVVTHQGDVGGHALDAGAHGRTLPLPAQTSAPRADEVRLLLAARARAVLGHDRAAFLATVDPAAKAFRRRQAQYFDNLVQVRFRVWRYSLDADHVSPTNGPRFRHYHAATWGPRVVLHYALSGFDRHPTSVDQYPTLVQRHGRWLIAADQDFATLGRVTSRDLWDFGPVVEVQHGRALVLGHPGGPVPLDTLADDVDATIPRVSAVWGEDWDRSVVLLAPDSEHELSQLLCDPGDLDQIAAVASVEVSCSNDVLGPVSNRVLINPSNFETLSALGRRIVLTHESTHVATRDVTGDREPTWLIEGFADYVGFRGTGVSAVTGARELAADLAVGKPVGSLPGNKAYDGTNPRIAQAYERSWLACRYIAERYGQRTLVQLYRRVGVTSSGSPRVATDRAMRAVLHISLARFTRAWQAYVESVLR